MNIVMCIRSCKKSDLLDRVYNARSEHIVKTGQPPNMLYVGKEEYELLKDFAKDLPHPTDSCHPIKVYDMTVFEVVAPAHLCVAYKD